MRPAKGHRPYPSIALPSAHSLVLGALTGTICRKKGFERPVPRIMHLGILEHADPLAQRF